MLAVFSEYLIFLASSILDCYIFGKFIKKKPKTKLLFLVFIFAAINCAVGMYDPGMLKIIVTNLNTIIIFKTIYNESLTKTTVGAIFVIIGAIVGELICTFAMSLLKYYKLVNPECENVLMNIIIDVSYLILYSIPIVVRKVNDILNWCENKRAFAFIFRFIVAFMAASILMYPISYNKVDLNVALSILTIILVILLFIVGYFKEKSDNNRLSIKFSQLLDYVKDYEDEVIEKGKVQHEYKNQLGVISGMIPDDPKLKELKDYVSKKLSKAEKIDNNVWLEKITNLPSGGIKGLVYLKIKKMLDNDIIVHIEIDNKLKSKNKWLAINNNLEDYTRIIGVYLDNAIDAASQAKEKQIIIEFIDNKDNIEFDISNTYIGDIEFDKIDNEKYSTKGDSRGYGLSIVKDIMDNNKLFSQERELNGKFFVEKLYIKKQD